MSTSSSASCASERTIDAPPNLITFDKCPRCRVQFDFLKRNNVTKVPLILSCKHTVCEDCIRRMCFANSTFCPICKEKFTVLKTQLDNLSDLFPPHFALIGHLVWNKNSPNKKNIGWVSTGMTIGNRQLYQNDIQEMSFDTDESHNTTDEDFDKVPLNLVFDKCFEHSDQFVNIQCEECSKIYCCYCFIENHQGHKATYLYKLGPAEMTELEKLRTQMEVILANLWRSKKQVKELKTFDPSEVDQDIKNYFAELHAKLHFAERNIRKKLLSLETEDTDVEIVNTTIKSGIYRVTQILNHFTLLNTKQLNVRALFEEAREVKDIPCRLVSNQGILKPIEFVTDVLLDDIEENISLKAVSSFEVGLSPIDNWSQAQEKYDTQHISKQNETPHIELQASAAAISKPPKFFESHPKKNNEGLIRVVVTHINSLDSFFVQKYNSLQGLKEMNALIGRRGRRRASMEEFKIGGIFGVQYETKKSSGWRRGKLLNIIDNGNGNFQYKMYYFDYGNTQCVTRDKLKELDLHTVRRSSFAYECKLGNLDETQLAENAHLHLTKIIGSKDLYLQFLKPPVYRNSVNEVELLLIASNGSFIPVRDLLLKSPPPLLETEESNLMGDALFQEDCRIPYSQDFPLIPVGQHEGEAALSSGLKLFKNSKQLSVGKEEQVVVVYIRDPFYICVQLVQNLKIVEKMKEEMDKYYQNKPILACIPLVGTDVVVNYEDEEHGKWHRASIKHVDLRNKQVEVFFVDWGFSTVVCWTKLRALTEEFIKVESQGIIVKFADIEKLDRDKAWPEKAVEFLREQISVKKQCRMVVSKGSPLEVALFQAYPAADLCLNSLLVENNHAISTGTISKTVFWPNVTDPSVEDDDLSYQMIKKSEEIIMADDDDIHLKTGLQLQVNVMSFQSPDLILVKFLKYKEKDEELHKELQIHYSSNKNQTKKSWKPGDVCVVLDKQRNNYFRAAIKSVVDKENYLVYLYDHVREIKVYKKFIFKQEPYFQNCLCYVRKCRLANIKPAGDAGKWSNLAVEILQKIFDAHKSIYIKTVGMNEEEKIFEVIMWYRLTTPLKALAPSDVNYISINQSLIECGLAFYQNKNGVCESKPVKTDNWYEMICEDENNIDEDKDDTNEKDFDFSNRDETFHRLEQDDWLPPMKLEKRDFQAVLTCVDNEGFFLVREEQVHAMYLEFEKTLTDHFNSMQVKPSDGEQARWRVNDMCTVNFEDKWYRAKILSVPNSDEVIIEMIDFGSAHTVPTSAVTKVIMFPDFQPFVNKIRLYDVYTKYDDWSGDDVNELLDIVTDNVRVVIKGDMNVEIPYAEVYLPNGFSVNDLITQRCPHITRRLSKVSLYSLPDIDEQIRTSEPIYDYNYETFPKSLNERHKLFVVNISKWDGLYYAVLSCGKANTSSPEFNKLTEKIQKHIASQPVLKNATINTPCLCVHPQKEKWSRALIYRNEDAKLGSVLVFFVDYGNVELVSLGQVREIRSDWLEYPVNMRIATMNFELVKSHLTDYVLMQMNNLRGKHVFVEIVSEDPLKVHLFDEKNNYCYENLISCGTIRVL